MDLFIELNKKIKASLKNNYSDNYDYLRFGKRKKTKDFAKQRVIDFLQRRGFYRNTLNWKALEDIIANAKPLNSTYTLLANDQSKWLFVDLLAFRLLGPNKIKLPLSNDKYWQGIRELERIANKEDFIDPKSHDFILFRSNLTELGFPVDLYYTLKGIYTDFVLKQYEYKSENVYIKADKGETIIDAGACWGDTALYFAASVGKEGKVYSYEFIPSNLDIFKRNVGLNPMFKEIINVVKKPLWDYSGKKLFFKDNGPGSRLSENPLQDSNDMVETIAIDDFVAQNNIERINFIKMDIEGAELAALKGAIHTIKRDQPKLAIAIYHSISDMGNIPVFINELNLGYKLYIGHYTIHAEETILFALPPRQVKN